MLDRFLRLEDNHQVDLRVLIFRSFLVGDKVLLLRVLSFNAINVFTLTYLLLVFGEWGLRFLRLLLGTFVYVIFYHYNFGDYGTKVTLGFLTRLTRDFFRARYCGFLSFSFYRATLRRVDRQLHGHRLGRETSRVFTSLGFCGRVAIHSNNGMVVTYFTFTMDGTFGNFTYVFFRVFHKGLFLRVGRLTGPFTLFHHQGKVVGLYNKDTLTQQVGGYRR